MPDCFEKSLKKVRCLLRFYILLMLPDSPLIDETWDAIKDMNLAQTEEDLVPAIKKAMIEVKSNITPKIDTFLVQ